MTTRQPGSEIAGYRIESLIGRGGMAVVYRAEDTRLARKVALKLLTPQLADSEPIRQRFIRESRLAASLDHPNIVPIYEAGEADGQLFIAMRYVVGSDLKALLAGHGGRLPVGWTLRLFGQIGDALDSAHRAGLVHRDVTPGNILITTRERRKHAQRDLVYLTDFGLTKRTSELSSGLTGTGHRHSRLRIPRADPGQAGGPGHGHLRAGLCALPVPYRPAALPPGRRPSGAVGPPGGASAAGDRDPAGAAGGGQRRGGAGHGQGAGRPLRVRRNAAARPGTGPERAADRVSDDRAAVGGPSADHPGLRARTGGGPRALVRRSRGARPQPCSPERGPDGRRSLSGAGRHAARAGRGSATTGCRGEAGPDPGPGSGCGAGRREASVLLPTPRTGEPAGGASPPGGPAPPRSLPSGGLPPEGPPPAATGTGRRRNWWIALVAGLVVLALAGAGVVVYRSLAPTPVHGASAPGTTSAPSPPRPVTVPGTVSWTDTGVSLTAGERFVVRASGEVSYIHGARPVGPDGDSRPHPGVCVLPGADHHAGLIGRISLSGAAFLVGSHFTGSADRSGELFLGINDVGVENNGGAFAATVQLSQP